ncbi:MAG: hypothetical protein JNL83_26945 [Myxococcales bacterium]|nr:hypothetical protein [Myxococcales bacterium]
MRRALAIGALFACAATVADARAERCFGGPMTPRPIIRAEGRVSGAGGIIVIGDSMPGWRFRAINESVRPDVEVLAPGLAIFHPPPLPGDDIVLEDTDHRVIARATRVFTIEPPLAAPTVTKVVSQTAYGTYTFVTATLTGAAPKTARALIVSRVERDRVVPLSWGTVLGEPTDIQVWHSPRGCDETITGWLQPRRGDRVVLRWVDDAGRVSEPSKPLVISEAPPRK